MTEILKQIEELENRKFMLSMKDYWSESDYDRNAQLARQIAELKAQL